MCWFIDVHVTPVAGMEKSGSGFRPEMESGVSLKGDFPHFRLEKDGCMCEFFRPNADRGPLVADLEKLLMNDLTRKLEVLKYWTAPAEAVKRTVIEWEIFSEKLLEGKMKENVRYVIIERSKFHFPAKQRNR